MAINKQNVEEFIKLRAEGHSFDKIAEKLKISKPTLIKWSKEYEFEINELVHTQRKEFLSEQKKAALKRAKVLSKAEDKVFEAIENRDYDNHSSKELFNIMTDIQKNKSVILESLELRREDGINAYLIHYLKSIINILENIISSKIHNDNDQFNVEATRYYEIKEKMFIDLMEYHKRMGTLEEFLPADDELREMRQLLISLKKSDNKVN